VGSLGGVEIVVLAPGTPGLDELLDERRRVGLDAREEIWEGEYHLMVPGPSGPHGHLDMELTVALRPHARAAGLAGLIQANIGGPDDHRVPDQSYVAGPIDRTYFDTAALVVEVVSPGDESWNKFDFFAAHGVEEVLIADPETASLHWFRLVGDAHAAVDRSTVLDVAVADIHRSIDW